MLSSQALDRGTNKSAIRDLFEYGLMRAKEIGKENVYDFSLGNPSVPSPKIVNETLVDIINNEDSLSTHGYTPAPGDPIAREQIAQELNKRFGCNISAKNIFFTCGAAPALTASIRALAVPDAEILILAPFFPEYLVYAEGGGAKGVVVPANRSDFGIHCDEIEKYITSNTRAIIINSPNNPSGVIYKEEQLKELAELLERKSAEYGEPIYIIADEPYRELVYDGKKLPFIPNIYKNTIVTYSFSKSLSIPGERIGYVMVGDDVEDSASLLAAVAGASRCLGHVCAPSVWQKVVGRCAEARPDIEAYDRNRQLLYNSLTEYGYECVYPEGAFYLLVRAPGDDAAAFSSRAKKKDILIVPCDSFGCPDYLRISTCVAQETVKGSLPGFKALIEDWKRENS